jgi:chromosome segregation ATPase
VQKLSAGHLTQDQLQLGMSSSLVAGAAHGSFPFQIAISEDIGRHASPQITRERNPSLNGRPSQPTDVDDKSISVPQEGDDSESSTEHQAKLVAPDTFSEKDERIAYLERQLSEMLAAQTQRDLHVAELTDQLAQKSVLLERAEANAAEAKKHAGLEQRELQVKFDGLFLSRDKAEANATEAKKHAGLELRKLQAKLDELKLSRDEHLRTLEQTQSSFQKATFHAAEANERCQRELAEVYAKLEARESELAAVRLRLADAEDGLAKSKAEADTLRAGTQAAAGLVNTDVDRVMGRLLERVRAVEAEMVSLRGNEKSIEDMECRNEG